MATRPDYVTHEYMSERGVFTVGEVLAFLRENFAEGDSVTRIKLNGDWLTIKVETGGEG